MQKMILISAILLTACQVKTSDGTGNIADNAAMGGNETIGAPVSNASPTPDVSPTPTPSPSPSATIATNVLTPTGWGPLYIGMSRADLVKAVGGYDQPGGSGLDDPDSCDEFHPAKAPKGLFVMLESNRLTRIGLGDESRLKTVDGLGIGAAAADIRAVYGARIHRTPHEYQGGKAAYLTVWTGDVPDPANVQDANARGLRYVLGEAGKVEQIYAGTPSIQYVEGCL